MDQFYETLKKEKRATYLVQIRKESTEKLFQIKRFAFFGNESEVKNEMDETYDVLFIKKPVYFIFIS